MPFEPVRKLRARSKDQPEGIPSSGAPRRGHAPYRRVCQPSCNERSDCRDPQRARDGSTHTLLRPIEFAEQHAEIVPSVNERRRDLDGLPAPLGRFVATPELLKGVREIEHDLGGITAG